VTAGESWTGEGWTGDSREDELLSRLYQQLTGWQADRFGAGYDVAAGLDRYAAWLREQTDGVRDRPERDANHGITALYSMHYQSVVRLAALLVGDVGTAEEIVQDSFIALHTAWRRLRDKDRALSYLRQAVVNRSRSVLRHRMVVDRKAPEPPPDMPGAEQEALALLERSALVSALRTLPLRQREALVLRYYADLSEAQIASAMGISRGAVKSHTARAVASLRNVLDGATE
jgi:RNA polymerase sigma-70 factor (sigma-E family)